MDCVMIESSSAVRTWLDSALVSPNYTGLGFESVHLDDLLVDDYSDDVAVELGFRLLDDLVSCLHGKAGDVMASLVIVLETETEAELHLQAPDVTQIGAAWDHFTPPELYLQARAPRVQPYVVEEYKKPYPMGTFPAAQGVYLGYYRCHRNEDSEEFSRAVHVEHYPLG
jgi:hypothetical protein